MSERASIELPISPDHASKRDEAVLALARRWDNLGDDVWEKIADLVDRGSDERPEE